MSDYLRDEARRMEREAAARINEELERGQRLAKQLVLHMHHMGAAASTTIPVRLGAERWEVSIKFIETEG